MWAGQQGSWQEALTATRKKTHKTYAHFKNPVRSIVLIVRLKADKLSKLTQSGKLFHISSFDNSIGKEICSHITASGFVQLISVPSGGFNRSKLKKII